MRLPRPRNGTSIPIGLLALLVAVALPWGHAEEDAVEGNDRLATEEAKLELLSERLSKLETELASLDNRQTTLLGELHKLDVQIGVAGEQLELLKLELKRGYRDIDSNLKLIQKLEASIANLKPYLESRSVSLYKLGRLSYVRLLLSVQDPSELTRAYRYISRLARADADKMRQFLHDQTALQETKAALLEKTQRMLDTRQQLEATTVSLEGRRASRAALLDEVYERKEMAGTLFYELEKARENLGALIERLGKGEATELDTVHLPVRLFQGELGWPAEGRLDARFGTRRHPRFQTVTVQNGIELEAPIGTPVVAVYDGEVVFASWFQGYGKLLIINHPGNVYTLYGYLSDFDVEEGDWLTEGDVLGFVGETGSLAGPRLYFEVRTDGKPVDPESWLQPSRQLAHK